MLDKPAGLVVHPAPGNEDGTLVNALLAHCGDQLTGIGGERRPGIVHRLDKDTSGIMVVAKTQLANTALTAAFAARDLDRAYLALVWGLPNPQAGEIEGAIGRDRRDRKRMAVVDAQRQAGPHPLPHAARTGSPRSPCSNAGWPPAGRIRSACTSPAAATPWSGIRSTCAACRPWPARCPSRSGTGCWTSPARRCTRPGSASPIRAPAQALGFATEPPPDMRRADRRTGA